MQIQINGNAVNVRFGVRFVRELDKLYPLELKGMKLGMVLSMKIPEILGGDIASLSDIIYAGTVLENNRPSQSDVDEFIENHEDIDKLFDDVINELEQSNAGKRILANNKRELKAE